MSSSPMMMLVKLNYGGGVRWWRQLARLYLSFLVLFLLSFTPQESAEAVGTGSISEKDVRVSSDTVYKCQGRLHDAGETHVTVPGEFMTDNVTTRFPLARKELNCKRGRFKVLFLNQRETSTFAGEKKSTTVKVLKTDSKSWKTIGYIDDTIRITSPSAYLHIHSEFFHPQEYCFDLLDPNELTLFVCSPICYGQFPCITKCCGQDEVWDVKNNRCRKAFVSTHLINDFHLINKIIDASQNATLVNSSSLDTDTTTSSEIDSAEDETQDLAGGGTNVEGSGSVWRPWLFSRSVDSCVKKVTALHRQHINVHIQERLPSCDAKDYVLIPLRKVHNLAFQRFRVLWSGSVIVRDKYGNWSEFEKGRFCVDGMVNFRRSDELRNYTGEFADQVVIACRDQVPPPVTKKPIPWRYAVMLIVSALILLFTALILLLDKQSVYEWTVCCEVCSMFFLILMVGIAHTVARRPEKSDFGSPHCVFIGAASHFFWLSTFFWLFIINFEIWWNFRSIVQLLQTRRWFRFMIYQFVGWGVPLLVVIFGLLLDRRWGLQNEDLDCANFIVPNYGQLNCYISKPAQGAYLFYPIGLILILNLSFYLLTLCKMWGYQRQSQETIKHRSQVHTQPIVIFAKLFIVMGVSWLFEVIAWAVTTPETTWVIFDLITLFQSISIFVIFIWKREVLSRMWHKFPSIRGCLRPLSKLPGCGIIPSERDRIASMHHQMTISNKIPMRESRQLSAGSQAVAFSTLGSSRGGAGGGRVSVNESSGSNGDMYGCSSI